MPAPRGAAAFEPIPPDLDLDMLVEDTPNFRYADRIHCDQIDVQGIEQFERLVSMHVIQMGKPLVVEGFQNRLDQWTFSTQWLRDNLGKKYEQARDLTKKENIPLSIGHYLDHLPMLTNQWGPHNYHLPKQRLYLKDIDCPELWMEKLGEQIPSSLFYLNQTTGQPGGPGAEEEKNRNGVVTRTGLGIARAGDLMSSLPPHMRAENMMCYIGHEGTYTPAHREMCASLGQNIMVECSGTVGEDGKPTKPGSSIWFMTETKDRHLVSEYWLSTLGHDIEVESHFAQIMAWKQAPFTVYIVKQKVGDFILIPPLAPHQVWNRGTRTMKAAWNRTTVETLELALTEALPRARMVCRDEQYKNKAMVLFTLNKYSRLLGKILHQREAIRDPDVHNGLAKGTRIKQLFKDFQKLFQLFHNILLSESFGKDMPEKKIEFAGFDSNVTCSYCRCNIFNRFLTCQQCRRPDADGAEDTFDICLDCYAMGRSCFHISRLGWVEQFPWKELVQKHDLWRSQMLWFGQKADKIPLPFEEALAMRYLKPIAQVCQEQLKTRPFTDPAKAKDGTVDGPDSGSESVDNDGVPKKKPKKRRSEKWLREHLPCHICCHRHAKWRMAVCECAAAYCYGSLWRGFDTMPQIIMQNPQWRCPKCMKECNCSKCRKDPDNVPYEPSATIIGHNTKAFADPRAVEAVVDFSCSNTHWLKKANDDNDPTDTRRLHRRIQEAEFDKAQGYMEEDEEDVQSQGDPDAIDPMLTQNGEASEGAAEGTILQTAREAMSALGGISQLEQSPDALITGAGLGVPSAMVTHVAPNGISYEYPDPQGSVTAFQPPRKGVAAAGKKRKRRTDYKQQVESAAAEFADDANRKFYKSQTVKTMAEAKKTGRLVIARAAATGESLVLKLRLRAAVLARFPSPADASHAPTAAGANGSPTAIVTSDLPKDVPREQELARNPHVPKKRHRGEVDGDFSTRRAAKAPATPEARRAAAADKSATSDSGTDDDLFHDAHESPVARREPSGRPLPVYLARRSPGPDGPPPAELVGSRPRGAAPPAPMVAAAADRTGAADSDDSDDSLIDRGAAVRGGRSPSTANSTPRGAGRAGARGRGAGLRPEERTSIFSTARRGKIRIVSAQNI